MRPVFLLASLLGLAGAVEDTRPNILYILTDDLGYGDVQALNPGRGRIPTPHLDRLAADGVAFSDAHSNSSVCTPTRYGILTGRYAWRTRLQQGVLYGEDPPLISPQRLTVPALLKRHGYDTACVGKWHLGMDLPRRAQAPRSDAGWGLDYAGTITGGPCAVGFDRFFGIAASLDMPPFVFLRDDRFTAPATTSLTLLRTGAAAADFRGEEILDRLTDEAITVMRTQVAERPQRPFFLYLSLTSPHTPILPTAPWKGRSGLGPYGDFVMQTDDVVGRVLATLDDLGLRDRTLVMFTSDNGCSPAAKVADLEAQGHFPSGDRRGYKADAWDGGHRVPLLCRWPGVIAPGRTTDQLACLTDLMATCAELLGTPLPPDAGEDSISLLPVLRGTATAPVRTQVVHHAFHGVFALREGPWKLVCGPGSGGWSHPTDPEARNAGSGRVQLYDLAHDLGEQHRIEDQHPEVVSRMIGSLERLIAAGRSTPGPAQANDVPVELWKIRTAQDH